MFTKYGPSCALHRELSGHLQTNTPVATSNPVAQTSAKGSESVKGEQQTRVHIVPTGGVLSTVASRTSPTVQTVSGASTIPAESGAPTITAVSGTPTVGAVSGSPTVPAGSGAPTVPAASEAPTLVAASGAPTLVAASGAPSTVVPVAWTAPAPPGGGGISERPVERTDVERGPHGPQIIDNHLQQTTAPPYSHPVVAAAFADGAEKATLGLHKTAFESPVPNRTAGVPHVPPSALKGAATAGLSEDRPEVSVLHRPTQHVHLAVTPTENATNNARDQPETVISDVDYTAVPQSTTTSHRRGPSVEEQLGYTRTGKLPRNTNTPVVARYQEEVPEALADVIGLPNEKLGRPQLPLSSSLTSRNDERIRSRPTIIATATTYTGSAYRMKPEPEMLMTERSGTRGDDDDRDGLTVTLLSKDYIWLRRGIAYLLLLGLLIVFAVFGLAIYYVSTCSSSGHTIVIPLPPQHYPNHSHANTNITDALRPRTYPDIRLSVLVLPHQYEVRLVPLLYAEYNFTFLGFVNITIDISKHISTLKLHALDLTLDATPELYATNTSRLNKSIAIRTYEFNIENQFLIIHPQADIAPGRYFLVIKFTGILNDLMAGFYRSSYVHFNKTRWIAATQFQPTDARRAFPCFDEPGMKARFHISVGRPPGMETLSNMNLEVEQGQHFSYPKLPEGFIWDVYAMSEKMSTYLVAVAVIDFDKIKLGHNFAVWARSDAIQQAKYSCKYGREVLQYFEKFFNIPYPLPKMDMLALPDFHAGAMENWGLTTFRETAMLYDNRSSSTAQQKRVGTVIAHELAHQWFGNLVTPWWWTDLWLNEGFASYVEYFGLDHVHPEYEIMSQFLVDELHMVLGLDSLETSHRISIEVHHHDEINEIFDRISYAKGAAIIRMMDHFLSRKTFQRGLTKYLNSKKFGNAEQDDLWAALTEQAHKDEKLTPKMNVKSIMDTWTLQTGYPVLTFERNYIKNEGLLSQTRFLLTGKNHTSSTGHSEPLWYVPVNLAMRYADFNNTQPIIWLEREREKIINYLPHKGWILINIQETGYYRVNYDFRNWKMILEQLISNHQEIPPMNRAQLLDDAMNLARAGLLDYKIALGITTYLKSERHYVPWKAGLTALSYLNIMLIRTGDYECFKKYVIFLLIDTLDVMGLEDKPGDTQLNTLLRTELITWACNLGHRDCLGRAVMLFQNWMEEQNPDETNPIAPNLKNIVYCTAIKQGTDLEWDFAWKRYLESKVASEQESLLSALGCSRETWILTRYLLWAVTENSGVRRQDSARVFASVAANPIGKELAFDFVRMNWRIVKTYFGSSINLLMGIVKATVQDRNAEFERQDLVSWMKHRSEDLGPATRSIQQAIEATDANILWMDTYRWRIYSWCRHFQYNPTLPIDDYYDDEDDQRRDWDTHRQTSDADDNDEVENTSKNDVPSTMKPHV